MPEFTQTSDGKMAITLPEIDPGFTIDKVVINHIALANDDSGTWKLHLRIPYVREAKEIPEDIGIVGFRERLLTQFWVNVSRTEIATHLGIAPDEVPTTLTLNETKTAVAEIALSKILPVMGITI